MKKIRHLIISGGGLKGIAFLGTLECLQRKDNLNFDAIETFAGSSAGSILSVLLVCGFSVAEIFKLVHDTNIRDLIDFDLSKITKLYGVESGHKLMKKFREEFEKKGIDPDITLAQLHEKTGKRLIITVSCIGKGVKYFDYKNEPELSVLLAVRMSIGIPLFLTAVKYKGDYYVDGGVLDNVPIKTLSEYNPHTVLTLRTSSSAVSGDNEVSINSFEDYIWMLGSTIFNEMEQLRENDYREHRDNALIVPINEHPSIDITNDEKKELIKQGYLAAKNHLNSDAYFQMRLESLPFHIYKKIWQHYHSKVFTNILGEIVKNRLIN